jgi:glycosyltransferase involved in cell wall biosynthesis
MKIALFHSTLPSPTRKVSGVEVVVHQLANHLVRAGHDVTVFSLSPRPEETLYDHVHLFRSWSGLLGYPLLRMFALPALLNRISFRDFDVVHFHGDDWFYVRRSTPSVRTLHGSALEEARTATSWKRRAAQYLLYPLERLAARLATLTLAIGPRTIDLYPGSQLVNNGVDLSLFRPDAKAPAPEILFVGTWEGRKRGAFLFDAFVREVLPSVPTATLNMVSDRVSDACRTHPNVTFWARPSDPELAALYRRAWVFAYPSNYEGFGLPYLEALASGTAVLCSPNDGADHVLASGTYGLIAEDADFGEALVHLLRSGPLRSHLEQKGLRRAASFSWDEVAQTHVRFYETARSTPSVLRSSLSPVAPS